MNEGYIIIEKFMQFFSIDQLLCLIQENFLQFRSNLVEKDLPPAYYVTPSTPVYGVVFSEILSRTYVVIQHVYFNEN
jgi:hypothetical protein